MICLAKDPSMKMREVALSVGITERAVQRIVAELEASGTLKRTRVGRQNSYEIDYDSPLRHSLESHRTVGDLLRAILAGGDASQK
ncbi:MAG: winged helix-turn-helix domain-containing protein [Armatimonadota bacterium]